MAIRITKSRPLTGTKRDLNLVMMYLLKATIYAKSYTSTKLREAVKVYQKAITVIIGVTDVKSNT